MKQIWIPKIGAPSVLEVRETDAPRPNAQEVLIQVKASGVNFADILARMGLYPDAPKLPTVVGYEVSGIIEAMGSEVRGFQVGDRVLAMTRFGGYSEKVVVPSSLVFAIPETLSFEKAAAIPVNYITAWIMLIRLGNLHPGEKVLIHAAAGGVGQAAIQICRWKNAEIWGTASASKHERLKKSGVAHCIDYHTQDFETEIKRLTQGKGVDLVLDAVGGKSFEKSYRCLAPLGRLFVFGVSSFAPTSKRSIIAAIRGLFQMPKFKPIALMERNRGVFGVNVGHLWEELEKLRQMFLEILVLVEQGVFDPVVDQTFSFTQAPEAHAYIQSHKNFGKVLLVPD